ncbi:MAG: D-alanine--D-alanine ligase family protein [Terriglobales bacterium]
MAKLRVGVIFGGKSGEHEVSLVSGKAVLANLDRRKYSVTPILIPRKGLWRVKGKPLRSVWMTLDRLDVVVPILHGPYGEDGTIQGMLELIGVPYVGAGVLGSAVGMDKDVMKRLFQIAGLPQVEYVCVRARDWAARPPLVGRPRGGRAAEKLRLMEGLEAKLRYPMFVKPANLGSSVGISKVHARAELAPAMDLAAEYDEKIVVEQGVEARELECAVLGNDEPEASILGEVISGNEFYDYAAKYQDAGSRTIAPAPVPAATAKEAQKLAVRAFQAVECRGMARVDFFVEKASGRLLLNEINTIPGFTPISMYPKLWDASGLPFPRLLDRLIELALEHAAATKRLRSVLP